MSNHTTLCANVMCANSGKMNNLKLETKVTTNDGTLANDTPLLSLMDTSDVAVYGPILQLQKNPVGSDDTGATGMDEDDQCGTIKFVGNNASATAANRGQITYGSMTVIANEVSDGTEAGTMTFSVAENDGTLTAGLTLTGSASTDGLVHTTISGGHPTLGNRYNLIADAADDTTITSLVSGYEYYYGTTTGAIGADDGNNAMTFKLPTPTAAGEYIKITNTCAAVHAKPLGFVTNTPATETITYVALDNGVFIESATTATGNPDAANVFVKLNASHGKIGDTYEFVSTSTSSWIATINGRNGLIAAGDINPASGHSGGYVT